MPAFWDMQRWQGFQVQSGAVGVDLPGGEAKHARGTVLAVFKKVPDGSWKIFRAMRSIEPGTPAKAGGL